MKRSLLSVLVLGLAVLFVAVPSALAATGHKPKTYKTAVAVTVLQPGILGHLSSPKGACAVGRPITIEIELAGSPPFDPISSETMSGGKFQLGELDFQPGMSGKVTVRVPKSHLAGGDSCAATSKVTSFAF